jgi:hypothetical protein
MLTDKEHTEFALNLFADRVIGGARENLKSFSDLAHSLEKVLEKNESGFTLKFLGNDYASYYDQGVKGKESSSRAPNSPFQFGTGSYRGATGQGGDWDIAIQRWIRFKGIKLRDEKGKFKKGGIKSLSYLIRRDKYLKGIKPSLFFTTPFNIYFLDLADELEEAYAKDIEGNIDIIFEGKTE